MTPPTKKLLRRAPAVLAAGLAAVLPFAGTASASPLVGHAHRTVTAADGETFHLRLTAKSTFLPAAGGTVDVRGKGYNRAQGIFLAFCVIPDGVVAGDPSTYTTLPTPASAAVSRRTVRPAASPTRARARPASRSPTRRAAGSPRPSTSSPRSPTASSATPP